MDPEALEETGKIVYIKEKKSRKPLSCPFIRDARKNGWNFEIASGCISVRRCR
jgi:hypothetical protein